nr:MAG TPA: hypothetical protein [Caudoviricetes sp.]
MKRITLPPRPPVVTPTWVFSELISYGSLIVNQAESVNFLFLGLLSSFLRLTILPLVFLMVVGTISKLGFAYTCLFSSSTLLRKALRLFTINY